MQTYPATYEPINDAPQVPARGSKGVAWPATGYNDPGSAAYGAWSFRPDGDENAYYVGENDLTFD